MDREEHQILDEYLVLLAQSGSRQAMGVLVSRWSPRLLRYAARMLGDTEAARDVVQETWASALRTLKGLQDPQRLTPWLYSITTRKGVDAMRRAVRGRRLRARIDIENAVNGAASDLPAANGLDLTAAIRRLPLEQRMAINLHYGEDLNVEDIATVLGVPPGTVKSRLHHARRSLKLYLEGDMT
jgi:RNA polymerase sigma factor (sigma-70 family)